MLCSKIALWEGRGDVTLTTYILDDSPEMLKGKKRPAVLVCPGGAYLSCSDREGEPIALRFASMGYHAFVLRYSVYSENKGGMMFGAQKDPGPKPHLAHPAPMRDIARAMLEIRANAEKWLVDTDRIAICGFSAGAHNCAMYSVWWDKPVMSEPFGVDNALLKPAACILGYPLIDYTFMKDAFGHMEGFAKGLYDMCNLAFTGTTEPDDATLAEISPNLHVSGNTPPMFIWSTAGDNLVPVQHSSIMATALANAGVPFELHIFEEGDHGLALADQATSMTTGQINADAAKWMPLCQEWLRKRLALALPETAGWE